MSTTIPTDCSINNIEPDFNVSGKQQSISRELTYTLEGEKPQKPKINKKITQRKIKKLDINVIYDKVSDEYTIKTLKDDQEQLQNKPILKRHAQKYDNFC